MVMPSISPSFTGGSAGPSSAKGGDQTTNSGIDIGFSNAFIVGGEGNTATGGKGQDFTMMAAIAIGGFLLWTILRPKK